MEYLGTYFRPELCSSSHNISMVLTLEVSSNYENQIYCNPLWLERNDLLFLIACDRKTTNRVHVYPTFVMRWEIRWTEYLLFKGVSLLWQGLGACLVMSVTGKLFQLNLSIHCRKMEKFRYHLDAIVHSSIVPFHY